MATSTGISFLENQRLELILFGGKGGVGKTTAAAATALYLARAQPYRKLLVISTDPAHSLADSFDCTIGGDITPIKDNLWALELNASQIFEDFMKENGEVIKEIAYRATIFDMVDIEDVFSLSIPGIDEAMAAMEIGKIHNTHRYDLIILDTAPTGHTVRLLALTVQLSRWIKVFYLMHEKHRYILRRLMRRTVKDKADEFLERISKDIARVRAFFRNIELAEFVPIVTPDMMAISETERLITALNKEQISVRNIIINRIIEAGDCPFCSSRRGDQQGDIGEIEKRFASYNLIRVPLFPHEVRREGDLAQFGEILSGGASRYQRSFAARPLPQTPPVTTTELPDLLDKDLRFILFGGKGGVGKTSLASATALHLARDNPSKRVLLFSTDPFASLSDTFNLTIGDKVTQVNGVGNLYALEIDADKMYQEVKREYRESIEADFPKPTTDDSDIGGELRFDKEILIEFVETSPPGLDEGMALERIMEFVENEEYDQYILDAAATGHLLLFLELPQLARERLQAMLRLLVKYKAVHLEHVATKMVKQAKNMRRLRDILIDPTQTEFVCLTIPEAMAVLEMEDLLSRVRELEIPCHHLVINQVVPSTECDFCATRGEEQQRYIQQVRRTKSNYLITELPLFPRQIRGMADLANLAEIAYEK